MSGPRFHIPEPPISGAELALPDSAAHHAARVLRLRVGDAVTLFDGRGGEYPARLTVIDRRELRVAVGERLDIERESPLAVTLVQAVSSGDRMDLTVQKAVELGIRAIVPVLSERSVVRLQGERAERRVAHWQQVAVASCEQCGRNRVPQVAPLAGLRDWLAAPAGAATRWLLSPRASQPLRAMPRPAALEVLVGPEGGFTGEEERAALAAGYAPVALGPRVLRTETAAPALLAAIQALWGDF